MARRTILIIFSMSLILHEYIENAQPFLFTLAQLERAISKGRTVRNGLHYVDILAHFC